MLKSVECAARWDVPYKFNPSVTLGSATANEFGWRDHRVFVWVGVSQRCGALHVFLVQLQTGRMQGSRVCCALDCAD